MNWCGSTIAHRIVDLSYMHPMGREDSSMSTGKMLANEAHGVLVLVGHPRKKSNMEVWKMFVLFDTGDFQVPCQFSGGVVGHPQK